MRTLIFDIETIGEDFDALDKTTQDTLTQWIKKESTNEVEYKNAFEDLKNGLGFSPLTGEIVAIGVLDHEKNQGVIYYQDPSRKQKDTSDGNFKFKPCAEKEMLENFWAGAKNYHQFVTFNGRAFDAPFLITRSAIHGVKPTVDMMEGRYLYQQKGVRHIDLLDQLTFYGTTRKKGNLHLWSRAFGIKSPKSDGISGNDVSRLFEEKKYLEIAKYNVGDLLATQDLFRKWETYFNV